jgi:deoxyribodipyrimidine photolyase-related protein
MILLILPNQLFNIKYIPKDINKIIIYEHPHYFKKYNYNKKKLVLHRASMKYYYDYLKDQEYDVKYIEYKNKLSITDYYLFDPIDKIKLPNKYTILDSPNFFLTRKDYKEYEKDKVIFNNFYLWAKKKLNIYPNLKSLDKQNRETYKEKILTKLPKQSSIDAPYIKEAIHYVNKKFPNNYGTTYDIKQSVFYPISHKSSNVWLMNFIKNKFKKFGPYQDFINKNNNYMFHSVLSSSINIGLLNPLEIVKIISKYKNSIPINSFEGYLRQLFWREYQAFCYLNPKINFNKNYFGNKKKLTKDWYEGTLNIKPVDDLIKSGFETGYIHHIGRLMVIGNFMNLSGISPKEGFRWFMEFSIDSYEWVMHQNVYDMVFFVTGGKTTTRPYISSSNYILKMSNYERSEWCDIWNDLYHKFINKNKKKLYKFRYYFPSL